MTSYSVLWRRGQNGPEAYVLHTLSILPKSNNKKHKDNNCKQLAIFLDKN